MPTLKTLAQRLREPSTWLAISLVLGLFGLPAPIVQAIGAVLDVAPNLVDAAAAIGAAATAAAMPEKPAAPAG